MAPNVIEYHKIAFKVPLQVAIDFANISTAHHLFSLKNWTLPNTNCELVPSENVTESKGVHLRPVNKCIVSPGFIPT